jgi:hypothetical protein
MARLEIGIAVPSRAWHQDMTEASDIVILSELPLHRLGLERSTDTAEPAELARLRRFRLRLELGQFRRVGRLHLGGEAALRQLLGEHGAHRGLLVRVVDPTCQS